MRYLIVSADDFGYSSLFNKRILELIVKGMISSTSAMVDWMDESQHDQVQQLKRLAQQHNVSIGLHIAFRSEEFTKEIERQYARFLKVFQAKPSHIDLHRIKYVKEGYPTIQRFANEKGLPCRNMSCFGRDIMLPDTVTTAQSHMSGSRMTLSEIEDYLGSLDPAVAEIVFHPGYHDPKSTSSYNKERERDAAMIEQLAGLLPKHGIAMVNYGQLTA